MLWQWKWIESVAQRRAPEFSQVRVQVPLQMFMIIQMLYLAHKLATMQELDKGSRTVQALLHRIKSYAVQIAKGDTCRAADESEQKTSRHLPDCMYCVVASLIF